MQNSGALRYFGRLKNGTTPPSGEGEYWDGHVKWATPEDLGKLTGDVISNTKRLVTEKAVKDCNLSILPVGSVIISTRAPIGHMAINQVPITFNQGCRGIIPSDRVHGPYLYYLLKSRALELNSMANGTTFVELSQDELAAVPVQFPPLENQRRIARFLDKKTGRIDELIEKKISLLDRLAENRQALINRAITKGLNTDAPMRFSGVDWLSDISEGWASKRLKYLATYNDEVLPEDFDDLHEIDYVEISGVTLSGGIEEVKRMTFYAAPSRARRKVQSGDILISTVRTYLRAITTVKEASDDLIASTGFCVVRPGSEMDSNFLGWFAKSDIFVSEIVSRSVGVSYPAINASEIATIEVLMPPLHLQQRIARFLDEKTEQIDGLIDKIEESKNLLKEYRSALITQAVTGQLAELR